MIFQPREREASASRLPIAFLDFLLLGGTVASADRRRLFKNRAQRGPETALSTWT